MEAIELPNIRLPNPPKRKSYRAVINLAVFGFRFDFDLEFELELNRIIIYMLQKMKANGNEMAILIQLIESWQRNGRKI